LINTEQRALEALSLSRHLFLNLMAAEEQHAEQHAEQHDDDDDDDKGASPSVVSSAI
jgi:hypothetical protein